VPQNGAVNEKFGVYKSVCCGAEIVITASATFPYCPHHPQYTTIWQPADFGMIPMKEIRKRAESDPAA